MFYASKIRQNKARKKIQDNEINTTIPDTTSTKE